MADPEGAGGWKPLLIGKFVIFMCKVANNVLALPFSGEARLTPPFKVFGSGHAMYTFCVESIVLMSMITGSFSPLFYEEPQLALLAFKVSVSTVRWVLEI